MRTSFFREQTLGIRLPGERSEFKSQQGPVNERATGAGVFHHVSSVVAAGIIRVAIYMGDRAGWVRNLEGTSLRETEATDRGDRREAVHGTGHHGHNAFGLEARDGPSYAGCRRLLAADEAGLSDHHAYVTHGGVKLKDAAVAHIGDKVTHRETERHIRLNGQILCPSPGIAGQLDVGEGATAPDSRGLVGSLAVIDGAAAITCDQVCADIGAGRLCEVTDGTAIAADAIGAAESPKLLEQRHGGVRDTGPRRILPLNSCQVHPEGVATRSSDSDHTPVRIVGGIVATRNRAARPTARESDTTRTRCGNHRTACGGDLVASGATDQAAACAACSRGA